MRDLLQPYDKRWGFAFEGIKDVLIKAIPGADIQHVGSTAIPGVPSKPILDIDIIIQSDDELREVESKLVGLGYLSRGDQGVPGRYAFRQPDLDVPRFPVDSGSVIANTTDRWMSHHLYLCLADSLALKNHLCFRDALLADPVLAQRYGQMKWTLARVPGMDRETYTRSKTEFILEVLSRAGFNATEIAEIAAANR